MVNYALDNPSVEGGNFYTNYYESPTDLIHTSDATFLISQSIPSPMGANLTAFNDKNVAEKIRADKGGTLYTWDTLKKNLKK
jgi:copper chaperone NosL